MIVLFALAAAAIGTCPVERARYTLRHHPEVTAIFHAVDSGDDWPNGVVLMVRDAKTKTTSWWLPWNGGTDELQNISSTENPDAPGWQPPDPDGGPRPHGDREFIGMDAHYWVAFGAPHRGGAAPAHFLLPTTGGSQDDVFHVRQMFDLVGCAAGRSRR
ncbi:hypothetical protein [Sphingomonas sp. 8AM]|uniref:hypothetical protein n=1 Tax=Sphingomonas sp. 8AM TaxID=2653170 RepID=UPI0012F1F2E7|nr:hypothetical protein [Sphingomonas sp. 8AM]VXC61187.1 conserved hypothetical protein [Sphingomonas sp. 8AM]